MASSWNRIRPLKIPTPIEAAATNTAAPLSLMTSITPARAHSWDDGTSGPSSTSKPPPVGCLGGPLGPLEGAPPETLGVGIDENGLGALGGAGGLGGCAAGGTTNPALTGALPGA